MATNLTGPLVFVTGCLCAGTGCFGHVALRGPDLAFTPVGYQGAAQHTWTMACDGFHEPGQCPRTEHRHHFTMVTGGMACACGEAIP